MADLQKLYDAVLNGDQKTSVAVTREALTEGADPMELITKYMIPAMDEVGKLFEGEEYFVPELLLSGRAMKGSLELLRPLLAAAGVRPAVPTAGGTTGARVVRHGRSRSAVATRTRTEQREQANERIRGAQQIHGKKPPAKPPPSEPNAERIA